MHGMKIKIKNVMLHLKFDCLNCIILLCCVWCWFCLVCSGGYFTVVGRGGGAGVQGGGAWSVSIWVLERRPHLFFMSHCFPLCT
jgi:hypothetical protein